MSIKVCATCKHLEPLCCEREFEFILDTEYILFRCNKLQKTVKEFYLMIPVEEEIKVDSGSNCIFWEDWRG